MRQIRMIAISLTSSSRSSSKLQVVFSCLGAQAAAVAGGSEPPRGSCWRGRLPCRLQAAEVLRPLLPSGGPPAAGGWAAGPGERASQCQGD